MVTLTKIIFKGYITDITAQVNNCPSLFTVSKRTVMADDDTPKKEAVIFRIEELKLLLLGYIQEETIDTSAETLKW